MFEDLSSRNRGRGEDANFVARFGGQQNEDEVQRLDSERSAGANIELANRGSGGGHKIKVQEDYQSLYAETKK